MKYAIIADIHGNLPAMEAVINDAKEKGAEEFIFLGDYYGDFPWPNEVVALLQTFNQEYIIGGNKEGYLRDFKTQDQSSWVSDQFAALYWAYKELEQQENLEYLAGIEARVDFFDTRTKVTLLHALAEIVPEAPLQEQRCSVYTEKIKGNSLRHGDYPIYMAEKIKKSQGFERLKGDTIPQIFMFGHTHVQWHTWVDGYLFINPGSCGAPKDARENAPYTMLSITEKGWKVEEHRVSYNEKNIKAFLYDSELYKKATVWGDLVLMGYQDNIDYTRLFLTEVEKRARENSEKMSPVSNKIWNEVADEWYNGNQLYKMQTK